MVVITNACHILSWYDLVKEALKTNDSTFTRMRLWQSCKEWCAISGMKIFKFYFLNIYLRIWLIISYDYWRKLHGSERVICYNLCLWWLFLCMNFCHNAKVSCTKSTNDIDAFWNGLPINRSSDQQNEHASQFFSADPNTKPFSSRVHGIEWKSCSIIFVADKIALNYHLICENTWGSILSEPETFLSGSYRCITVWKALQHIVCCLQRNHATTQLHFLWKVLQLNSSPPSAAYMRQWIRPALVQIMACCLFGAKPLSKLMLEYC